MNTTKSTLNPLRNIVIVGGGTSGWIAASMLSFHLKPENCKIHLIESDDFATIGIGESTIPPLVRLIQNLGIPETEFIQQTQACFKLGIKFVDWKEKNHHYFHPFGTIGNRIGQHDFYQCWLKASQQGEAGPLQDYSPCSVMAEQNKFYWPAQLQNTPLGGASYAVHLDAKLVVNYLREYSQARGVNRIEGTVDDIICDSEGKISQLKMTNQQIIEGDFFIDCTGFKALLLEKTLGVGFVDWSDMLPCDRAIVIRTEAHATRPAYTTSTARKSGWSWKIPLQNSTGHGYVFSSKFCSDEEAKSTLLKSLDAPRINEARVIPFMTGHRTEFWHSNCLAVGLSSGFVEPLEATSIHLIARAVDFFLRYFPDRDCEPSLIKEYNRRMTSDFEEVRDFILLHYCTTQRNDSEFWRHCQTIPLPDSLKERIELFKGHGIVPEGKDELFRSSSWQSVFDGMGIRPKKYSQRLDNENYQDIKQSLQQAKQAIQSMVDDLPSHDEFLKLNL